MTILTRYTCILRPVVYIHTAALALLSLLVLAGCTQASAPSSQTPVVTVSAVADSVARGKPLQFHVRAEPAPRADLTVNVTIASSDCELAQSSESVTINAGDSVATLTVATAGLEVGARSCEVSATVAGGEDYAVGGADSVGSSPSATATITDSPGTDGEPPGSAESVPLVTIARERESLVYEGDTLRFELTADPAPAAPLTVNLRWDDPGGFLSGTPPHTVTIPASGTLTVTAATDDDDEIEYFHAADVSVTVVGGDGYRVGDPDVARIGVNNNDSDEHLPRVTVQAEDAVIDEGDTTVFTLTASPPAASDLPVNLLWRYRGNRFADPPPHRDTVTIPAFGEAKVIWVTVDDLIDNYFLHDAIGVIILLGPGYVPGERMTATVIVTDDEVTPVVEVAADSTSVLEGSDISFTLTGTPAPTSDVTVNIALTVSGVAGRLRGTLPTTVTLPTSGTAKVTLATTDNDRKEPATTTVTLSVEAGDGYYLGELPATITIMDDD